MFLSWFRHTAKSPANGASTNQINQDTAIDPDTERSTSPKLHSRSLSDSSDATTPKALPQNGVSPVPTFSLAEDGIASEDEDDLPPPQFPAINSAQRASSAPHFATRNAVLAQNQTLAPAPMNPPGLMAPPPRPAQSNSLRVPSTGPLPNRSPTVSQSMLRPMASASAIPNPRKKVLLAPGHSPLDWANLQRSNTNLSGVSKLLRVTPSMLKAQNGRKGKPAWSSYQGKVYNITPYLPFHPGGEGELKRAAGKDGEKLFLEVHPWVNWDNMLGPCLVGIMVSEIDPKASDIHEMDTID
jgi:cytochrome b involved in lipid metabolism